MLQSWLLGWFVRFFIYHGVVKKKHTFIIHWSMMENDTNFGMLGISCHQSTNLSRKRDTRKCHQNRLTIRVS